MNHLLTQKQALEYLNISRTTLLRWEEKRLVSPIRLESGHRRYPKEQLDKLLGMDLIRIHTKVNCVIYSRVSTKKQQLSGNLRRQTDRLKEMRRIMAIMYLKFTKKLLVELMKTEDN